MHALIAILIIAALVAIAIGAGHIIWWMFQPTEWEQEQAQRDLDYESSAMQCVEEEP